MSHPNSFNARQELSVGTQAYQIYQLSALTDQGINIDLPPKLIPVVR